MVEMAPATRGDADGPPRMMLAAFAIPVRAPDPAVLLMAPSGGGADVADPRPQDDADEGLDGRRVLVVEDEVIVALELSMELEDRGAVVAGPAHSLSEAIALAEAGGIEAAILDVDLQGLDVYPVAERLMAAGVPFVFHTGHGDRGELKARFGGAPVCIKPTLSEELVTILAGLLR